jgi:hypothetical protein
MEHEPRVFPQITGNSIVEYTDIGNKKKYVEFKSEVLALEFANALCETRIAEVGNMGSSRI